MSKRKKNRAANLRQTRQPKTKDQFPPGSRENPVPHSEALPDYEDPRLYSKNGKPVSRIFPSTDPEASTPYYYLNGIRMEIVDESEGFWKAGQFVKERGDCDTSQYAIADWKDDPWYETHSKAKDKRDD